jgi:hypothetical protein
MAEICYFKNGSLICYPPNQPLTADKTPELAQSVRDLLVAGLVLAVHHGIADETTTEIIVRP